MPTLVNPAVCSSYTLCSFQGKAALEIWTAQDLGRLWQHLHNGNGPFDFVMGFRLSHELPVNGSHARGD